MAGEGATLSPGLEASGLEGATTEDSTRGEDGAVASEGALLLSCESPRPVGCHRGGDGTPAIGGDHHGEHLTEQTWVADKGVLLLADLGWGKYLSELTNCHFSG